MYKLLKFTIVIKIAVFCVLTGTSTATTNYVSLSGGNIPPYNTWTTAAVSIQDAIGIALDGDTVLVANGKYDLNSQIVITNGIILRSVGGATNCIVDVQSNGRCLFADNSSAVIDGLTITGGASPATKGLGAYIIGATIKNCLVTGNNSVTSSEYSQVQGGGIYLSGGMVQNCVISNNYIEGGISLSSWGTVNGGGVFCTDAAVVEDSIIVGNSAAGGVAMGGGIYCSVSSVVRRCYISQNDASSYKSQGGGVFISSGSSMTNCIVHGNTLTAIRSNRYEYLFNLEGGGIYCSDASIQNCTIGKNVLKNDGLEITAESRFSGAGLYSRGDSRVQNTAIYYNYFSVKNKNPEYMIYEGTNYHAVAMSNEYSHCLSTPRPSGAANIEDYPGFIRAASGDYRLRSSSPCIDSGNAIGAPTDDINGVIRPIDGAGGTNAVVDIGAHEFDPSDYVPPFAVNDFNGDGSSELAVYNASKGGWYITNIAQYYIIITSSWGPPVCQTVSGDFKGDGHADFAYFIESTGNWDIFDRHLKYVIRDDNWGFPGCTPVAGDYDGDGIYDQAVYDNATGRWFIKTIKGEVLASPINHGYAGTTAVSGDYDGDGVSDLAVFDRSSYLWYIISMKEKVISWGLNWGYAGCVPVSGDYDGDGISDLAMYHRPSGNWYITDLNDNIIVWEFNWGFAGCVPVSIDYDADGVSDLAVYHQSSGNWYIILSSDGQVIVHNWGWSEAVPVGEPLSL